MHFATHHWRENTRTSLDTFMDTNQSMMLTSAMHELFRGQRSKLAHQGSREDNLYQSPQRDGEHTTFHRPGPDWLGQKSRDIIYPVWTRFS